MDSKLHVRCIQVDGKKTTIALDPPYWALVEARAKESGQPWYAWVRRQLEGKPEDVRRARWLRLTVIGSMPEAA